MKTRLIILILCICFAKILKASEIEIIEPLGFTEYKKHVKVRESTVTAIADSLNKKYALDYEKYDCLSTVSYRALFKDMSYIWYFRLYGCAGDGVHENRFSYIFYNEKEQTVYIPNGDLKAFNSVFHKALYENFKPTFILNLLSIYVNVAVPWECNLIYGNDNDMRILYSSMNKDNLTMITLLQLKWLKELYPRLDTPVKMLQLNNIYTVEFNTFNRGERVNQVNNWVFNVYPDSIVLVSNKTIEKNINLETKQDGLWHEMGFDTLR